jgi:hypothetical protein
MRLQCVVLVLVSGAHLAIAQENAIRRSLEFVGCYEPHGVGERPTKTKNKNGALICLGFWLSDALNRKLKSVDVIKATALKFRLLSIRLTSEVFETDRNMSAIAIYHSWVVARRWGVAGQIITE